MADVTIITVRDQLIFGFYRYTGISKNSQ